MQLHIGITTGKLPHRNRERVTGMQMAGGQHQPPATVVARVSGDQRNVFHLVQQALRRRQDGATGFSEIQNPVSTPYQQIHAQLLLQQLDLPTHTRLRSMQRDRSC